MKKRIVLLALAITLLSSMVVFAYPGDRPIDALEDITGRTSEELHNQMRDNNKTPAQIAEDAGKLAEYKNYMVEHFESRINFLKDKGRLTEEEANTKLEEYKEFIKNATADELGHGFGGRGFKSGKGYGYKSNQNCENFGDRTEFKERLGENSKYQHGEFKSRDGGRVRQKKFENLNNENK